MVSVWVPVIVALVAAVPVLLGVYYGRRDKNTEVRSREAELTVNGLVALITELQEERTECLRRLHECLREGDGR